MECKSFRILLQHVSDHLSVFFLICMSVPLTTKASITVSVRLISEKKKFAPLKSLPIHV